MAAVSKSIQASATIAIPKGVNLTINSRTVTVAGPKGQLQEDFRHTECLMEKVDGGKKFQVSLYFGTAKQNAVLRTICAQIENMILGVTKQFEYRMKTHQQFYPIELGVQNNGKLVVIKNFMGEKNAIQVDLTSMGDVVCKKAAGVKDEIILTGTDLKLVSQSAALINQSCAVPGKHSKAAPRSPGGSPRGRKMMDVDSLDQMTKPSTGNKATKVDGIYIVARGVHGGEVNDAENIDGHTGNALVWQVDNKKRKISTGARFS